MTEGTHEQADALLREWEDAFGHQFLGSKTRAYFATRPAPVDPDRLLARKAIEGWRGGRTAMFVGHMSCGAGALEDLALRAIKLAKEQQA